MKINESFEFEFEKEGNVPKLNDWCSERQVSTQLEKIDVTVEIRSSWQNNVKQCVNNAIKLKQGCLKRMADRMI